MKKYMLHKKGILYFALLTVDALNVAFMALLLKQTLDTAISGDFSKLLKTAFYIGLFLIEYSLVSLGTRTLKAYYISDIMLSIKKDLLSNLLHKDVRHFSEKNSAECISFLNNDLKMFEDNYIASVILIYRSIVILIVSLGIMLWIQPLVSLIAIFLAFLPVLIPKLFGKKLSLATQEYAFRLKKYNRLMDDILKGFSVVKNYSLETYMEKKHDEANRQAEQGRRALGIRQARVDVVTNLIAVGMQFCVFVISGFFVVLKWITAGDVIAITQLMNKVVNPVFDVVDNLNKIKSVGEIKREITEIVKEKNIQAPGGMDDTAVNTIRFQNVSFSYSNDEKVLSDINLKFEKGKKYAIIGETGSGKSTLLKLILGYYENFQGEITYNDRSIRSFSPGTCLKNFSYMSQNVFLFEGTIRENIAFDSEIEKHTFENLLTDVKLRETFQKNAIDENYLLTNNGENLSGGEREKVALARVLLHKKDWILLDEPTASMDIETFLHIEKRLLEIPDIGLISITHRYEKDILEKYHQIIVMNRGKVAQIGTYEEIF